MKSIPFSLRVADVIAAADQATGITGREVAEAMGLVKHAEVLRVQQARFHCVRQHRVTTLNGAYPARFIVTRNYQPPDQRAAAAKDKAEADRKQREARARSHARRQQALLEKQARIANARKTAARTATPPARTQEASMQPETTEQFIARGGSYQVLPHNFDARPTTYPGRRPINNHNQRGRNQP